MTALPKGLVSKQQLQMMGGIKTSRTNLLPSNASGSYSPKSANRIIFSIPSFPNSFINTKRSYIRFKITSENNDNAIISPSLFPFKRMMLKSGRGQVLEDIDSYDVLCRIMNNLKTESTVKSKKTTHKDSRVEPDKATYQNGKNCIHELHSGVLGSQQEYLIPVSAMQASSGAAFTLELWLSDVETVFPFSTNGTTTTSYKLEEVSYDMELVEVTPEIMTDINTELSQGAQIPLPYKSMRQYSQVMSSGTEFKSNISESAINVNAIYSVIRNQLAGTSIKPNIDDVAKQKVNDPYNFVGGRFKLESGGADALTVAAVVPPYVKRYSYRYGSVYFPLSPVDLDVDSTVALENIVAGFELQDHMPLISEQVKLSTGAYVPRYESGDFMICQNFKVTNDPILSGLNAGSTGAPIELNVSFGGGVVSNLEFISFVESTNVLYISKGGASSMVAN